MEPAEIRFSWKRIL